MSTWVSWGQPAPPYHDVGVSDGGQKHVGALDVQVNQRGRRVCR
jgi:hypothetical protein